MKPSNSLILGSGSPRRKQLLLEAGFEFEVRTADFDEVFPDSLPVNQVAEFLAKDKNNHMDIHGSETILTADTVVISNGSVLGKPTSKDEAVAMLESLSDNVHQVITGVCIRNEVKNSIFSSETQVKVKELSAHEINHYIDKYQPYDKAGAYGIQEWFGAIAVEWINGSYFNVVGLPVSQVYEALTKEFNIIPSLDIQD